MHRGPVLCDNHHARINIAGLTGPVMDFYDDVRTIVGLTEMPSDIQEHAIGPFPGGYPNMWCRCVFPGKIVVGSEFGELGMCRICIMIRCGPATVGGGRWKVRQVRRFPKGSLVNF